MADDRSSGVSFNAPSRGGQTGRLIREKDWSATRLGPRDRWSRALNNYLSMILELPTPAILFWGPDQIQLYNDGYAVIMGPRHPRYLGAPFRECWPEAYETIEPWMRRVMQRGETVEVNRTLVPLTRFGFIEEAYFTFSFSPLRDDDGRIAGVLQLVTEVTDVVLGERRATALHALSDLTTQAQSIEDATRLASAVLRDLSADLPFAHIYVVDPLSPGRAVLSQSPSTSERHERFPREIDVRNGRGLRFPEISRAIFEHTLIDIDDVVARFGPLQTPSSVDEPTRAVAMPIGTPDRKHVVAVLLAGLSPRLTLDARYRRFLELVTAQLAILMAAASAYSEEKKRSEALAAIDRAKTDFFNNISHEFRTPLTLILGPLEDALRDPSATLRGDALEAAHRNALRLLGLVNTLLDFARIESNRQTPTFEPTDLSMLTAGLAGSFQSLLDSAGLTLLVDCPSLPEPVYVDRAQWEAIVLNLISNAFKFTFAGEIAVRLQDAGGTVRLSVSDTGTGIPSDELPKLFERFHRVKGARGRSFEGSGIGLSMVQELTRRHGGTVNVESTLGKGTTFVVSIPKRPPPPTRETTRISESPAAGLAAAASHVLEAQQWHDRALSRSRRGDQIQPEVAVPAGEAADQAPRERVLVADDNADMRQYLVRLLSPKWAVATAEDGETALAAALRQPPDLVLSDVMMPGMDGVALLTALRANPKTSTVPIVLLSARAGEEAIIDGLDTGADDYLAKPFTSRELLARVQSHLNMARLRREWAAQLERANKDLEAFTYSVSHDLRAPLRAIEGFTNALMEEYGAKLDDTAGHYLRRVRKGASKMAELIEGLLDLSRISRVPVQRAHVDVTALVSTIIHQLQERERGRVVEASVAPDLAAEGDPRLLAVVFDNLLGNAWKFTANRSHARIEVGQENRGDARVFYVRDNGAGFDMTHAARLFAPFQRLHTESEFPGTGIGLATVQRVVFRHGGTIWAHGMENRGATFYFTLGGT